MLATPLLSLVVSLTSACVGRKCQEDGQFVNSTKPTEDDGNEGQRLGPLGGKVRQDKTRRPARLRGRREDERRSTARYDLRRPGWEAPFVPGHVRPSVHPPFGSGKGQSHDGVLVGILFELVFEQISPRPREAEAGRPVAATWRRRTLAKTKARHGSDTKSRRARHLCGKTALQPDTYAFVFSIRPCAVKTELHPDFLGHPDRSSDPTTPDVAVSEGLNSTRVPQARSGGVSGGARKLDSRSLIE